MRVERTDKSARSLFEQFGPHLQVLSRYTVTDHEAWAIFARQLEEALEVKDLPLLRASFAGISDLNRENMMRAFEAARTATGLEASSS